RFRKRRRSTTARARRAPWALTGPLGGTALQNHEAGNLDPARRNLRFELHRFTRLELSSPRAPQNAPVEKNVTAGRIHDEAVAHPAVEPFGYAPFHRCLPAHAYGPTAPYVFFPQRGGVLSLDCRFRRSLTDKGARRYPFQQAVNGPGDVRMDHEG